MMRRLLWLSLLVLPLLGAALGLGAGPFVARAHRDVRLAREIWREESVLGARGLTQDTEAFWNADRTEQELYQDARRAERNLTRGSAALGGWLGLVLAVALLAHAGPREHEEYVINHLYCVACARCYMSCPAERDRRAQREITDEIPGGKP